MEMKEKKMTKYIQQRVFEKLVVTQMLKELPFTYVN
jgi:hypothetical protein